MSREFLAPYEVGVTYTPHLQKFAEQSVTFANHNVEAGTSGISYASIFTGTQADQHGVYQQPTKLRDDLYLIFEAYADRGYEPFYWNGHRAAAADLNFGQGVPSENIFPRHLTAGDVRFVEMLQRLQADPDYKAFVVTNPFSSHSPYRNGLWRGFLKRHPAERRGLSDGELRRFGTIYRRESLALEWSFPETIARLGLTEEDVLTLTKVIETLYKSNIEDLDRQFGAILETIRQHELFSESLIVFTADHGEAFYRPSLPFKFSHSAQLAPEVLRVPFLLSSSHPAVRRGSVYPSVTRSIDVFPTMIGLSKLSLPPDRGVRGDDLSRALTVRKNEPSLVAFSHTSVLHAAVYKQMYEEESAATWTEMRRFYPRPDVRLIWVSLRDGERVYKYRNLDGTNWGFELFDSSADPDESTNLFDEENPVHRDAARRLREYKQHLVESYDRRRDGQATPGEKEEEILRRLGYIR